MTAELALSAAIAVLALLAGIGLLSRHARRRRQPPAAAPASSQALAVVPEQGQALALAPPLAPWRPPPRERLLRRQDERNQATALRSRRPRHPAAEAAPFPPDTGLGETLAAARARRRDRPPPATGAAAARPAAFDPSTPAPPTAPAPASPADQDRPSRIGRQRQGLESLITEPPPPSGTPRP